MTPRVVDLINLGKQFSVDERIEVAHQLLLSVEESHDRTESSEGDWGDVLERRAREAIDGGSRLIPVGQSHESVRGQIAALRCPRRGTRLSMKTPTKNSSRRL